MFAFLPPKVPTYTFRPRIRSKTVSSNAFRNNSQHSQFSGPVSAPNYDSMNLRIYRIGSQISQKDYRPYRSDLNSPKEQIVYNKSPSQIDVSSLNNHNRSQQSQNLQRKPTNRSDTYYRPKSQLQYPAHDLKKISPKQEVVNIDDVEDLTIDCYFIQTQRNQTIPVMLVQPQGMIDYVLIYSHPNALDIGLALDNYFDISFNLKINVLAYDYTGYGQSTGEPSDIDAIADIEAVYEFAVRQLGFPWQKVILYGWSIGSGPSVTLAADYRFPVAGLVIHSGLASGLRKFDPTIQKTDYMDIFPNIDLIEYVNTLVYILHGDEDTTIDMDQAIQLSQKVRNLHKFWLVEEGGHNDIQKERFRDEYFAKLGEFIQVIRTRNEQVTPAQLLILNRAQQWSFQMDHYYSMRMKSKASSHLTTKSSFHPTLEAAPPSLFDRENSQRIDYELTKVIQEEMKESNISSLKSDEQPQRLETSSDKNDSLLAKIQGLNMEEDFKQNDDSQISFCS